jgi:poly(A) polymerase
VSTHAREFATEVVSTLRQHGHRALLVGGCVRDLLLGREPADYDVATDARPEQVMRIFPETYAVGAKFGVVLVPITHHAEQHGGDEPLGVEAAVPVPKHDVIEVATFRCDVSYSDGRHPDAVRYSESAEEDVQRRDFTINGLLMDPANGEVMDFVGGKADLNAGIIRTIGDPEGRFAEDKLRMLRAVRFAARFDYQIDGATFATIQKHAGEIHQVSHERIRDELLKMLTEGHARRAFELLDESGLLREILPEVQRMKGVQQPPQFHPEGDVWTHTLMLLDGLEAGCSITLAMGALLHDVGKPPTFRVAPDRIRFDGHVEVGVKMAEEICRRYRFSNDDTEQIAALVANHMRFADAPKMKASTLKKFLRQPRFEEHLELHRLDCTASHGDLSLYEFTRQKLAETPPEQIRPAPLITGDDLIALGFQPGPVFREILSQIEDLQLDGKLANTEEAIAFVQREFSSASSPKR